MRTIKLLRAKCALFTNLYSIQCLYFFDDAFSIINASRRGKGIAADENGVQNGCHTLLQQQSRWTVLTLFTAQSHTPRTWVRPVHINLSHYLLNIIFPMTSSLRTM